MWLPLERNGWGIWDRSLLIKNKFEWNGRWEKMWEKMAHVMLQNTGMEVRISQLDLHGRLVWLCILLTPRQFKQSEKSVHRIKPGHAQGNTDIPSKTVPVAFERGGYPEKALYEELTGTGSIICTYKPYDGWTYATVKISWNFYFWMDQYCLVGSFLHNTDHRLAVYRIVWSCTESSQSSFGRPHKKVVVIQCLKAEQRGQLLMLNWASYFWKISCPQDSTPALMVPLSSPWDTQWIDVTETWHARLDIPIWVIITDDSIWCFCVPRLQTLSIWNFATGLARTHVPSFSIFPRHGKLAPLLPFPHLKNNSTGDNCQIIHYKTKKHFL